ncbi:unnamed protein product [Caenorhabditis brenneri]
MTLYDKVISILSIPDKNNSNDSDIGNSTDLYEQWARGDGQFLLPLTLVFIVAFCLICAMLQVCLFLTILCVRKFLGAGEDEWEAGEEHEEKENSKRDYQLSLQPDQHLINSTQAESTGSSTTGDGTPRSRKSAISSPKDSV